MKPNSPCSRHQPDVLKNSNRSPDRRYFRFLWRDLDMKRNPEVYEFEQVVFAKKSAPFKAQYTI